MSADLRQIVEIAPLVQSGALSPIALVRECLAQIDARPETNAFITRLDAQALADADACEREIRAGGYRGPLHGIPVSVKDLVDVAGVKTTSGSAQPAYEPTSDAPAIAGLRAAGAIIIGKTNLHEFAFGTTSEESAFGPVRNPHDPSRSAGGSSGGAAAALATGMCFGALGTDTGGSIRIPSAACGTVGLKATIGEISCEGVVPLSATLDHLGPMARSVADVALLFDVLSGRAAGSTAPGPAGNESLVFGVPRPYFCDRIDAGVRQALERTCDALAAAGHTVRDLAIEHAAWTPDVYLHIVLPEASRLHARLLERSPLLYSPGVRVRLEMGRYLLAEDYVRAMRLRGMLAAEVDRTLDGCDALLLPALPIPAPPLGATTIDINGTAEPIRAAMLRLTQLFNITGHPSLALPAPHDVDSLPRGVQVVARRGNTNRLLAIGLTVEQCLATHQQSVKRLRPTSAEK
jgi:aspartyl-tRNA(Asn)/glutamyl-tRNA(Gln) amidotransferase subunit A